MTNKLLLVLVLVLLSFCLVSTEKSESTKNEALDEECRLCPLIYDPGFLI
jgi:hypothetical protein